MYRRRLLTAALAAGAGCGSVGDDRTDRTVDPQLAGTPTVADAAEWTLGLSETEQVVAAGDRVVARRPTDDGTRLVGIDPTDGRRVWDATLSSESFVLREETPVLAVVDDGSAVVAFDPASGERLWRESGGLAFRGLGPATVVVERRDSSGRPTAVIGVDRTSGERLWRVETARTSFGVLGGTYLHTRTDVDGSLIVGRDARDGSIRWVTGESGRYENVAVGRDVAVFTDDRGSLLGVRLTNGEVTFRESIDGSLAPLARPGPDGGLLYGDFRPVGEATPPGRAVRVDPTEGVVWSVTVDGESVRPFARGAAAYGAVGGGDGELLRLEAASGAVTWRRSEAVVARDERGPYTAAGGTLRAISPDGSVRWRTELATDASPQEAYLSSDPPETFIVAFDRVVIVIDDDGLRSYDPATGGVRTDAPALGGDFGAVALADGRLVYATSDRLYGVPV